MLVSDLPAVDGEKLSSPERFRALFPLKKKIRNRRKQPIRSTANSRDFFFGFFQKRASEKFEFPEVFLGVWTA